MQKANRSLIIVFLLLLSACAIGQPKIEGQNPDVFVEVQDIENLTVKVSGDRGELIRENAKHFWAWSRKHDFQGLQELLKFETVIVGDSHYYNFGDVHGALSKTAFSVVDIDDGGFGPALLDFIKFGIFVKSADPDISIETLFDAYVEGLSGLEFRSIPEKLKSSLLMSYSEVLKLNQNRISKKIKSFKFKKQDLNLITIEDLDIEDQKLAGDISDFLLNHQDLNVDRIYDAGFTVHENGGSKGKKRFWFLVKSQNRTKILEFKELGAPATAYFRPQKNNGSRVRDLTDVYLNVPESGHTHIQFRGVDFWMREKYIQIFDSNVIDSLDLSERAIYAQFIANYMGNMQNQQFKARSDTVNRTKYLDLLTKNPSQRKNEIKSEIDLYLETLGVHSERTR